MKTFLGVVLTLAILAASLEGAADIAPFGSLGTESTAQLQVDGFAGSSTESGHDECAVCTPFCHCSVHGSALVAAACGGEPPSTAPLPVRLEAHYFSLTDPPSTPPPIV